MSKPTEQPLVATTAPIVMVTSIAPGNVENQKAAMQSWLIHGFSIVSLNNREEVNQLQPIYTDITFYAVNRDAHDEVGKPLIYLDSVFDYLREYGTDVCGIVNSDIHLKADSRFVSFIRRQAKNSVLFASRVDVNSIEEVEGEVLWIGFDVFFFDKQLIKHFPFSKFCLGIPMWDYWLPLIVLTKGICLKYVAIPVFHHVKHLKNWGLDLHTKYAIHFTEFFGPRNLSTRLQKMVQEHPIQTRQEINKITKQTQQMIYFGGKTIFITYNTHHYLENEGNNKLIKIVLPPK